MTQKATLALGCFWGVQAHFDKLPGVTKTVVGYSGGTKENPTYHDLGDHSETIEITFDPAVVSYETLLDHFWQQHDPLEKNKRQYRSAIFFQDEAQKIAAEKSLEEITARLGKTLTTAIEPASAFYPAEEYHQHYLEKMGGGASC